MSKKIGVLDSGIGGLTTVKSLQELLPGEDIIYFGDNKNVPYGNKSKDEILALALKMIDFFKENDVKIVAIACNTISTLIDSYRDKYEFPIIDIISPTADYVVKTGLDNVAILGTEFTVNQASYNKLILKQNPDIDIISEGSKNLAALVDGGKFDDEETKETISTHLSNLKSKGNHKNLVLACTHYPIVQNIFLSYEPDLNLINPAYQQAKAVKEILSEKGLLSSKEKGSLNIYTSGGPDIYTKLIERLELKNVGQITTVDI